MKKSKQYDEFVDKFKPRHTTDDCFTPPNALPPSEPPRMC